MSEEFGRVDYTLAGLAETDLSDDPLDLFRRWYDEAYDAVGEPNAMVLATVGPTGPTSRTVLLKSLDGDDGAVGGFTFFTNYRSAKASDLDAQPRCALLFPWYALQRQVRVEGLAHRVDGAAYFATRPRASQLGAWASVEPVAQSGVVADRAALDAAYEAAVARFAGHDVPCPPSWGGYAVVPDVVEFWQGRTGRLHDRLRYRREGPDGPWNIERLAP